MKIQNELGFITKQAFDELSSFIKQNPSKADSYLQVIADLIRFNTLVSVARAGTGHLGASLSMIELLTEIYFRSFSFNPRSQNSKDRDIFILSKGHAAPSLYATLAAKGYFPIEELDYLRRLGHLEGHCDISTPGIEANTGSLAMGLSKAVGYAIAKKSFGLPGNIIVIVGDGELQEGQCWEAILSAVSYKLDNLYVIIDDNKVQTDQFTKNILQYGKLVSALADIGFHTVEGKGRNVKEIQKVLSTLKLKKGKPKLFWCHTVKGQGVNYMEHSAVLKSSIDKYIWHNKAPNVEQLKEALEEIIIRVNKLLDSNKLRDPSTSGRTSRYIPSLRMTTVNIPKELMQSAVEGKSLITGFAQALLELGKRYKNIVVIDGDLEEDCGFIPFHKAYPTRFFEMGIMEQHMVATTCALSRLGYIPVISTYAAFLTSRANEQLYNLATEKVRALIVGNMSGILPATPGKSHQAFRDISCMKNIPGICMYQPISADDAKNAVERYLKGELGRLLYLRLSMAASRVELSTPKKKLEVGKPHVLVEGKDVIMVGIGPVILGECMKAAEELEKKGIEVEIWNHPWLTQFEYKTYLNASKRNIPLLIIEDHFYKGGFGESLLSFLGKNKIIFSKIEHIALRDFPQTGFREEALKLFGLHKESIAAAVKKLVQ